MIFWWNCYLVLKSMFKVHHLAPSGKFYFLLPVGEAGLQHQLRLSKSYLTLTEPILRYLTGCGQFTPVVRPIDKSPKVRDFGQQIPRQATLELSGRFCPA